MSLISTGVPNLLSGVSQQPAAMRFPSQADEQINAYPSVIDGLIKRPPTEHVQQLISGNAATVGNCLCHLINRDATVRYAVVIRNGVIQVTNLNSPGTAISVTNNGASYITTSSPQTDLKALTVGDYTFVVNTTKTPALFGLGNLSPSATKKCLITVVAGAYQSTYTITFGTTVYSYTTTTSAATIATDYIAQQLEYDLINNVTGLNGAQVYGYTNWVVRRKGSTIEISRQTLTTSYSFTYPTVTDGQSNRLMTLVTNTASKVTDLPLIAPDGYAVKVVGDESSNYDDYYLKFKANTENEFGLGVWQESIGPSLQYIYDPYTMPHVLVRNSSTSFEFKPAVWDNRLVGDDETCPIPSFIGKPLKDVFFFKNRLGFIAQDKIVLSEAGSYFNFWRSSVLQVLDGDPIDLGIASPKVASLSAALPFSEQLLLFGDQTQFVLSSGTELLTPKTATVTQTTDFRTLPNAKPITNGRAIFFAEGRGDYSGIREYVKVATNSNNDFDAQNITAQVPAYIKGSAVELDASTHEDLLFVRTEATPDTLYCYKYLNNGQERVQSAWFKFAFAGSTLRGMGWIDTSLYLFNQRSDGLYLEKVVIEAGRKDTGLDFVMTLDRRITEAACTVSYSSSTNQTTFSNLPYTIRTGATMLVVSRANSASPNAGVYPIGTEASVVSASGTTIVVSGNWSAKQVYIGEQYDMLYRTSTCFIRQGNSNTIVPQGRFQIGYGTLVYTGSSYFTVAVAPKYRDTYTYTFTGNILGSNATIGSVGVWSGNYRFPIFAKNDEVSITISNDSPLPCGLTSLDYEGTFNTRSRRV